MQRGARNLIRLESPSLAATGKALFPRPETHRRLRPANLKGPSRARGGCEVLGAIGKVEVGFAHRTPAVTDAPGFGVRVSEFVAAARTVPRAALMRAISCSVDAVREADTLAVARASSKWRSAAAYLRAHEWHARAVREWSARAVREWSARAVCVARVAVAYRWWFPRSTPRLYRVSAACARRRAWAGGQMRAPALRTASAPARRCRSAR